MKKFVLANVVVLIVAGCALSIMGYRNYRLFIESQGSSDYSVHLEQKGKFSVIANPPGRSCFRPGGVLEVQLTGTAQTLAVNFISGTGQVRVTDRSGVVCLEERLEDLGVGSSRRGKFLAFPREFDTSRGGPCRVELEISEPFYSLTGIAQVLSVHHFVCGNEAIIHIGQFSGSAFLLVIATILGYKRLLTTRCSEPRDDAPVSN